MVEEGTEEDSQTLDELIVKQREELETLWAESACAPMEDPPTTSAEEGCGCSAHRSSVCKERSYAEVPCMLLHVTSDSLT